jgi:hypothetical protein
LARRGKTISQIKRILNIKLWKKLN